MAASLFAASLASSAKSQVKASVDSAKGKFGSKKSEDKDKKGDDEGDEKRSRKSSAPDTGDGDTAATGEEEAGEAGEGQPSEKSDVAVKMTDKTITDKAFFKLEERRKAVMDEQPMMHKKTDDATRQWEFSRRWKVRLWDIRFRNLSLNEMSVFLCFIFGGDLVEYYVRKESGNPSIWRIGEQGTVYRTHAVQRIQPADKDSHEYDVEFMRGRAEIALELKMSYKDVNEKKLRCEVWNWDSWSLNQLNCYYEQVLHDYATGNTFWEHEMINTDEKQQERSKVSFQIAFEEIYDWELCLMNWKATDLPGEADSDTLNDEDAGISIEPDSTLTGLKESSMSAYKKPKDSRKTAKRLSVSLFNKGLRKVHTVRSNKANGFDRVLWEVLGTCSYRGTVSELEDENMDAWITSHNFVELFRAKISLAGVLNYGYCKGELISKDSKLASMRGKLEGRVSIPSMPLYRQAVVTAQLKSGSRYLLVKVLRAGNVSVPFSRRFDALDTFVSLTYDGHSFVTNTCFDNNTPSFKDEMAFDLRLVSSIKENIEAEMLGKGPLQLDLWSVGKLGNDHLGGVDIYIRDVLFLPNSMEKQKVVTRTQKNPVTGAQEEYGTRCFMGKRTLVGANHPDCYIQLDACFSPDFEEQFMLPIKDEAPKDKEESYKLRWETQLKEIAEKADPKRNFRLHAQNHRMHEYLLPSFLSVLKPPMQMHNLKTINHFVASIPFDGEKAADSAWAAPSFLSMAKKGSIIDHCLLHASLLLGLPARAFVCLGTTWNNEPHAWVLTLGEKVPRAFGGGSVGVPGSAGTTQFMTPQQDETRWTKYQKSMCLGLRRCMHCVSSRPQVSTQTEDDPVDGTQRIQRSSSSSTQKMENGRISRHTVPGLGVPRLTIRGMKRDPIPLPQSMTSAFREETYVGLNGHRVHPTIWDTSLRAVYELPSTRIAHQRHALEVVRANIQPTVNCMTAELDSELKLRKREQLEHKHKENRGPAEMTVDSFHPHPIKFHSLAPVPPPPNTYECVACGMDIRDGSKPCYACDTCAALFCWSCCEGVYSDAAIDAEELDFTAPARFDDQLILPYKTIEVMFNHANMWANLQNQNPGCIYYDVWNPMYWYKFAPSDSFSFSAHFARDSPMRPPIQESKLLDMRRQIEEAINLAIQTRRSECSRTTAFSRDSNTAEILRQGLEVHEIGTIMGANTAGYELKKKWMKYFYSKVPQDHKMLAWPLLFNFAHPDMVAQAAMEHLDRSAFNEPNAVFSSAAHLRGWPNGIITVFVYILLIQPAPRSNRARATISAENDKDSRAEDLNGDMDAKTFDISRTSGKRKTTFAFLGSEDNVSKSSDEPELIGIGNRNPNQVKEEAIQIMKDLARIKQEVDEGGDEDADEDETDVHKRFLWANIMCLPMNPDSQIELDQSRMEATISPVHQGTFSYLISEGPVPQDDEFGGFSFGVQIKKVTKKSEKSEDNFCIGCTTQSVEQVWRNKPTGIENIKGASAVGFEGMMYTSDTDKWAQIQWNPSTLREGDILRFWVNHDGESRLFLNDVLVCHGPDLIDVDNPLFAIVSIAGRVEGIRLLSSDFNRLDAVSFFLGCKIEQNGNTFWKAHPRDSSERLDDADNPGQTSVTAEELLEECGILCDYILPRFPGSGYYFEVIVEKNLEISDIGLAVGVTTIPQKHDEVPSRLAYMEYTWMMGYDGLLQTEGKPWIIDEFLSAGLRANDVVGVLIELTGAMEIMVNGHVIARSSNATIPIHSSIYPVVDLTGNAIQISLNFDCQPFKIAPICTGWVDPNFIGMSHAAVLTEDNTIMTQRTQNLPLLLCLGDAPMILAADDYFFQIEILETQTDVTNHHGFVIGCTGVGYEGSTRSKLLGASHVRTIDKWHTEETLLIMEKHIYDGCNEQFFEHDWDFALKKGDMLTFVLTAECVVLLLVNDVMVVGAETAFEIRPVYPILDIRGTIKSCKLIHCAPPRWKFSAMGQHVHAEESTVWTIPELEGFTGVIHSSALDESMSYKVTVLGYGVQEGEEGYYPPLPNGIALGVCLANQVDIPITLDFLCQNIFLIGFDGQIWDGERWTECNWDSRDLCEGDVIQIKIRGSQIFVLVNEKQVCISGFTLPKDVPLFPCVDLFAGFGVEMNVPGENVLYQAPLPMRPLHVPYARQEIKDSLNTKQSHVLCVGKNIVLKGSTTFKRAADGGDNYNGVILATPLGAPPVSFSLQIKKLDEDKTYAPILGVCVVHDPYTLTIPPMIHGLDCVWCIGYDGQLYDSSTMSWNKDVALDPRSLEVNDFLTLTITRELRMQLRVNGNDVAYEAPIVPDPATVHLFPCFDLFGCAQKVVVMYDADPHGGGFCMRRHGQSISAFGMRDSLTVYDQLALKTPSFIPAKDDEEDDDEEADATQAQTRMTLRLLSGKRAKSKWAAAFAIVKDLKKASADCLPSNESMDDIKSLPFTAEFDTIGVGKGKGFIRALMGFKGGKTGCSIDGSSSGAVFGALSALRGKGAVQSGATRAAAARAFLGKAGRKWDTSPSSKGSGASHALSMWQGNSFGFGRQKGGRFQFARLKTSVSELSTDTLAENLAAVVQQTRRSDTILETTKSVSPIMKRWQKAFAAVKEQRLQEKTGLRDGSTAATTQGQLSTMKKGANRWQNAALLAHRHRIGLRPQSNTLLRHTVTKSVAEQSEGARNSQSASDGKQRDALVTAGRRSTCSLSASVVTCAPRDTIPVPLTSCLLGEGVKPSNVFPDKRLSRTGKYFCGVLSTIPLPTNDPAFDVTVVAVDKVQMQGFIVGVSTQSHMNIPSIMCDSSVLYAVGYDGQIWDGGNVCDWYEDDKCWDPTTLASGDTVRLQVVDHSTLDVFVNHRLVASEKMALPPSPVPLYPFVDLFTGGVTDMTTFYYSYSNGEEPPPMLVATAPEMTTASIYATAYAGRTGIRASLIAPHLRECPSMKARMSSQKNIFSTVGAGVAVRGHVITKIDDCACCCLIGASPLGASSFFEILVESIQNQSDTVGIVLGVTTNPHLNLEAAFNGDDDVWCIGYDGQTLDGPTGTWESIEWDPSDIIAGDHVGCEATSGELRLWMNGAVVAVGPRTVPDDLPLFPVIHMYGHVLRFAFLPPDEDDGDDSGRNMSPNRAAIARKMASAPKQQSMRRGALTVCASGGQQEPSANGAAAHSAEGTLGPVTPSLATPSLPLSPAGRLSAWLLAETKGDVEPSTQPASSPSASQKLRNTVQVSPLRGSLATANTVSPEHRDTVEGYGSAELDKTATSVLREPHAPKDAKQLLSSHGTSVTANPNPNTVSPEHRMTVDEGINLIMPKGVFAPQSAGGEQQRTVEHSPLDEKTDVPEDISRADPAMFKEDGVVKEHAGRVTAGSSAVEANDNNEDVYVPSTAVNVSVVAAAVESTLCKEGSDVGAGERRAGKTQEHGGKKQWASEQDNERGEFSIVGSMTMEEENHGDVNSTEKAMDETCADNTQAEDAGIRQNNVAGIRGPWAIGYATTKEENILHREHTQKVTALHATHSSGVIKDRDAPVENADDATQVKVSSSGTNLQTEMTRTAGSKKDEQEQETHDEKHHARNANEEVRAEGPKAQDDNLGHDEAKKSTTKLKPNVGVPDSPTRLQSLSLQNAIRQSDAPPCYSHSKQSGRSSCNIRSSSTSRTAPHASPRSVVVPRRMSTASLSDAFVHMGLGVHVEGACCTKIGESTCNVIGSEPLLSSRYFAIIIDDIDDSPALGPALGVSLERNFELPPVLGDMPHLWCIGYDGQVWDGGKEQWLEIPWNPEKLRNGDAVGCKVTHNTLELYVNDILMSSVNAAIPRDVPLYPVIDLLDQVRKITFCRNPSIIPVPRLLTSVSVRRSSFFASYGAGLKVKGASATRIGESYCGAITHAVVCSTSGFDLRVDAIEDNRDNSIVLGFCRVNSLVGGMPDVIGATDQFWCIGYGGQMWDGSSMTWSDVLFDPTTINVGDWLTCKVANGMLTFLVNDHVVAAGPTGAPDTDLFPVFDLLGSVTAVTFFVRGGDRDETHAAKRPTTLTAQGCRTRKPSGIAINGIFATVGDGIAIEGEGGRTCVNVIGSFSGVVVAAPLTPLTGDDFFEVTLDDMPDPEEGIVLGVSARSTFEMPEVLCDRDFLWCVGYDGQAWDGSAQEWCEVDFDPGRLRVGDTIGVRVHVGVKMELCVNGHVVADTTVAPPADSVRLYPVVDLLGVRQITFCSRVSDAPQQETMS